MNYVGIDVSCQTLELYTLNAGKPGLSKSFDNTAAGHKSLIKGLSKLKGETRVCLEATGIYHFDLAVALSRAQGIEVMVLNPKASHHFARVMMTRSKTDRIDAQLLAQYCQSMPFVSWQRPTDEALTLRAISRRIATLTRMKTQNKNQLHALAATAETPAFIIQPARELVEVLDRQIQALRDSALETNGN